ncbi:hypothetical protein EK904_003167 [Melospiza melodia maxima]|nr:hypothetical protein EK904_003167 [Melospiza melodia maxima]
MKRKFRRLLLRDDEIGWRDTSLRSTVESWNHLCSEHPSGLVPWGDSSKQGTVKHCTSLAGFDSTETLHSIALPKLSKEMLQHPGRRKVHEPLKGDSGVSFTLTERTGSGMDWFVPLKRNLGQWAKHLIVSAVLLTIPLMCMALDSPGRCTGAATNSELLAPASASFDFYFTDHCREALAAGQSGEGFVPPYEREH